MKELIKRLETASEGSRELDLDIIATLVHPDAATAHGPKPAYTTSLDAALTLVPEQWDWIVSSQDTLVDQHPWAACWQGETDNTGRQWAKTSALALCIAALKARQDDS